MSDEIDYTNANTDMIMELRLTGRIRYLGVSAKHCYECGEDIPQGRREAVPGVKLCVECAS